MKKINIGFILLFLLLHAASPAVYALDSDVEADWTNVKYLDTK
ncbi:hypothetical protein [Lactococcus petauri]|nr:hypothetical protein [Lactococcus petauri]